MTASGWHIIYYLHLSTPGGVKILRNTKRDSCGASGLLHAKDNSHEKNPVNSNRLDDIMSIYNSADYGQLGSRGHS